MAKIYDIAIVGGGIAGLSLANSLLHSAPTRHLTIALLEANQPAVLDRTSSLSNRTSSLTPTSVAYLQSCRAWPFLDQSRIQSYQEMYVYDGISDQQIEFEQSDAIATMTENINLSTALIKALAETKATMLIDRVQEIVKPTTEDPLPTVKLTQSPAIRARLVVGADGFQSPVRQYAGIASYGWDYPHHGVVGTLRHSGMNHACAHQRMLPCGPIAFLPFPNDSASMVWSIHPRYATLFKGLNTIILTKFINAAFRLSWVDLKYILNMPPEEMESELDWRLSLPAHSRHAPPEVLTVSDVASFPLRFRHADTYHADPHLRAVLIGDAAHTIHPLAGQGLNSALLDSASLSRHISEAVTLGGDIGLVGNNISRDRYWANARVAGVVDKIHKLYAREEQSIVSLRSLGSGILDKMEFAKRAVMSAVG